MAKHRMAKKRRARRALVATAAAAGMSGAVVLGQTVDTTPANPDLILASTVIGVGGRDDPTSTRLQNKLGGDYALGFDATDYVGIHYPATVFFQSSIDDGVPKLAQAMVDADGNIRISSYSEGTLVAEQVKRNLAHPAPGDPTPPPSNTLDFVFIASPYLPNGGIFARLPGFRIPGLLPTFGAAEEAAYNSTYVTNEYDGFADFPAYFNPLSLANALLGMAYAHPDQYYDGIDLATAKTYEYERDNSAGGHDTYILVYNPHLPLLGPIRQLASLLALTPLTEPVLGAIEPLLRVIVDMGYTDRVNANPATPTGFSFITPPGKFVEAAAAIPGALTEGLANLLSGGQDSPPLPNSDVAVQLSDTSTGFDAAPDGQARMVLASDPQGENTQPDGDQKKPLDPADDFESNESSSAPTQLIGAADTPTANSSGQSDSNGPSDDESDDENDGQNDGQNDDEKEDGLRPRVTVDGNGFTPGRVGTGPSGPSGPPGTTSPSPSAGATSIGPDAPKASPAAAGAPAGSTDGQAA